MKKIILTTIVCSCGILPIFSQSESKKEAAVSQKQDTIKKDGKTVSKDAKKQYKLVAESGG